MRIPDELTVMLDAWAEARGIGRSEAARRLIQIGLRAERE
jgi:hypothetical protein